MSSKLLTHVKPTAVEFCRANYDRVWIQRNPCPFCEKRAFMVGSHEAWYGTDWTCLGCGNRWCDGERMPRPFEPKWWDRRKRDAREHYRRFNGITRA